MENLEKKDENRGLPADGVGGAEGEKAVVGGAGKEVLAQESGRTILETLNPKQRLFLSLIMEGNKTVEAYNKAGYRGDEHAAYTLKTRLNKA